MGVKNTFWFVVVSSALVFAACDLGKKSRDKSADDDGSAADDDDGAKKKKKKKKKKAKAKKGGGSLTVRVSEGEADGIWTPGYELRRIDSDTGRNYLDAMAHCRFKDLMLCSETQWERACKADAAVGKVASWTATWRGSKAVVRGGGGCGDEKTVDGASTSDDRAGLCCERAIGLVSGNTHPAFRKIAHIDQLAWENAVNSQNGAAIDGLIDQGLEFDGKVMAHSTAVKAQKSWWKAHPEQWTFFDVCNVTVEKAWNPRPAMGRFFELSQTIDALVHDCQTVAVVGDKLTVVKMRFARINTDDGKNNKVVEIKHHDRTRKLAPL
jgi:hypothetical protein